MSKKKYTAPESGNNENFSLNDDRRVKVLSPGALVTKRFIRNRLAMTGLIILIIMFAFSFLGGVITPYAQDEKFYRTDIQVKDYAGVTKNIEFRYSSAPSGKFSSIIQAQTTLAIQKGNESFTYKDVDYTMEKLTDDFYTIKIGDETIGYASKMILNSSTKDKQSFDFSYAALTTFYKGENSFKVESGSYTIDEDGVIFKDGSEEVAYISHYIVKPIMNDVFFTREFKSKLIAAIENGDEEFVDTDEEGTEHIYIIKKNPAKSAWDIRQETDTTVFDTYSGPSKSHWLGTDRNGMDMLTRLMYGGRVSLIIGFIVVIIETILGIIMGGISGYFGGWVDNLIMRIVDVFYCIPSMPIIIIIGAAMDNANLESSIRMLYLMLILGFLGWPGVARMVRGQILSLRDQEFMTAAEATGLSVKRRIFKHLIPNVIPQLIVIMTMGLGNTIILEATLSFLGLGVRFPFASWGNIINDVNNVYVLTHYWNIWIPAGVLLLLTVLAFNIVGDGLRDAFDPRMKR